MNSRFYEVLGDETKDRINYHFLEIEKFLVDEK